MHVAPTSVQVVEQSKLPIGWRCSLMSTWVSVVEQRLAGYPEENAGGGEGTGEGGGGGGTMPGGRGEGGSGGRCCT